MNLKVVMTPSQHGLIQMALEYFGADQDSSGANPIGWSRSQWNTFHRGERAFRAAEFTNEPVTAVVTKRPRR